MIVSVRYRLYDYINKYDYINNMQIILYNEEVDNVNI